MRLSALVALSLLLAQAVPAWTATADPASAGAPGAHWTLTLSAPYCAGYRIDDGVFIRPEPPLALPDDVPAEGVLFAGQAARVWLADGVLRVLPSPDLAQSMICRQGDQSFNIELLPSLGLANPDAGDYILDVWIGSNGSPVSLPLTITDSAPVNVATPAILDGQVLLGPTCPVVRVDNSAGLVVCQ